MEDMEDMEDSVDVYSTGASTKESTKSPMEVMDAFAKVMEASTEATSMEA